MKSEEPQANIMMGREKLAAMAETEKPSAGAAGTAPTPPEQQELREWKRSAMDVFDKLNLQDIGKELGLPLGADISAAVLPGIRKLKSELAEARASAPPETSQEEK